MTRLHSPLLKPTRIKEGNEEIEREVLSLNRELVGMGLDPCSLEEGKLILPPGLERE